MDLYKKTLELAPNDDVLKTIASYQIAEGLLMGFFENEKVTPSRMKELYTTAAMLEDMSYPLFGDAHCEGKTILEDLMAQYSDLPIADEEDSVGIKFVPHGQEGDNYVVNSNLNNIGRGNLKCIACDKEYSTLIRCDKCRKALYCSTKCKQEKSIVHDQDCTPIIV